MHQRRERHKKMLNFETYKEFRDTQDVGPEPVVDGETQVDPEKEDRTSELVAALKDIISVAKSAMQAREKGLGDKPTHGKPNEEEPDDQSMKNTVSRPNSDSAAGLFGQD